jgi:hypothetical protein
MSGAKIVLSKYLGILVSGKAGVGKSTFSGFAVDYAKEHYNLTHSAIFPFAFGVKEAARNCFGWDGEKDDRGRVLLQNVGKVGRDYDINIWVKKLLDKFWGMLYNSDVMLVDDWRFPNEGQYLEINEPAFEIVKVRIESPERESLKGKETYNDISETSLPSIEVDYNISYPYYTINNDYYNYVIANTGSLDDLNNIAKAIMDREINKLVFRK